MVIGPAIEIALLIETSVVFDALPIRSDFEVLAKVKALVIAVKSAGKKDVEKDVESAGDSKTLCPLPFKVRVETLGLNALMVTEASDDQIPDENCDLAPLESVVSDTAPLVDVKLPPFPLKLAEAPDPAETSTAMFPEVELTSKPSTQTAKLFEMFLSTVDPINPMLPLVVVMVVRRLELLGPQPIKRPMWFPELPRLAAGT
jgi:hypothetical protein